MLPATLSIKKLNRKKWLGIKTTKLKIYKALLGDAVNDPEVIGYLQEYIDKIEAETKKAAKSADDADEGSGDELPMPDALESHKAETSGEILIEETLDEDEGDSYLPSPDELDLDLTSKDWFRWKEK